MNLMTPNSMTVAEFEAKYRETLDSFERHEIDELTITKQGRAVAVLRAVEQQDDAESRKAAIRALHGSMRDSVVIPDGFDLTAPVLDEELDAEKGILHR